MSEERGREDLDKAARMIEGAFKNEPLKGHPLEFLHEAPFKALITDLEAVFERHDSDPQVILCAVTEMIMRLTPYKVSDNRTGVLAARAAPIIRQLIYEHKQAPEILVIISAMITHLALNAQTQ